LLINGSVAVTDGSTKSDVTPVLIHVGDMTSSILPNGFVNATSTVVTTSSSISSKGHRPATLGWTACSIYSTLCMLHVTVS